MLFRIRIGFLVLACFITASQIPLVYASEQRDDDARQTALVVEQYEQRASQIREELSRTVFPDLRTAISEYDNLKHSVPPYRICLSLTPPKVIKVISEEDEAVQKWLKHYFDLACNSLTLTVALEHLVLLGQLGITGREVLELEDLCGRNIETMRAVLEAVRRQKLPKEEFYYYLQTRGHGVDIASIIANLEDENKVSDLDEDENKVGYLDQIKTCYDDPTSDFCRPRIMFFSTLAVLVTMTAVKGYRLLRHIHQNLM